MASMKTRVALAGGKYLVTHPRGRITRLVVRFAVKRVGKKFASASHIDALPQSRAIRFVVVGWIAVVLSGTGLVAGGIAFVVRRRRRRAATTLAGMPAAAPSSSNVPTAPAAAAPTVAVIPPTPVSTTPPETRDAPPVTPTTSPAAEAEAITAAEADAGQAGGGDDALVARVKAELFGGTPPADFTVESESGVITLRGSVPDEEAEVRFVRDAESVDGVKAVQSELQTASVEPGAPDD